MRHIRKAPIPSMLVAVVGEETLTIPYERTDGLSTVRVPISRTFLARIAAGGTLVLTLGTDAPPAVSLDAEE